MHTVIIQPPLVQYALTGPENLLCLGRTIKTTVEHAIFIFLVRIGVHVGEVSHVH